MWVLEVDGLVVRRGGTIVLPRISLRIGVGEAVGLVGPEGSGKSTFLRVVAGEVEPSEGRVRVLGMRPGGEPGLAPGVVAFLSDRALPRNGRTVREAVGRCLDRAGIIERERERLLRRVFRATELSGDRPLYTLSTGERRRLDVARTALIHSPLLLLDHPTRGLGWRDAAAVWVTVAEMIREETSLLVTGREPEELTLVDRRVRLDGPGARRPGRDRALRGPA